MQYLHPFEEDSWKPCRSSASSLSVFFATPGRSKVGLWLKLRSRPLERVMARLDDPEPLRYAPSETSETQLPGLLDRLINGDYADLVWKRATHSLSISYLKTGDPHHEFALYRIAEGGRIPEHTHQLRSPHIPRRSYRGSSCTSSRAHTLYIS